MSPSGLRSAQSVSPPPVGSALKGILELAKETVEAERQVEPEEEQDRALSALTELFNEVKGKHTHVIVERIVADIDAIVKQVRFDGWQAPPKANAK